jgi:hypothetical protein
MKLYEIADTYNKALLAMADFDDLPEEVINDTLEAIEGEFKDKAIASVSFFKNIEVEIEAMKQAEASIKERRLAKEKRIAWVKSYILKNMQKTGINKIECPYFTISLRNNPESVNVIDEDLIPDEFKSSHTVCVISKQGIKNAGGCLGAELVRNQTLVIK